VNFFNEVSAVRKMCLANIISDSYYKKNTLFDRVIWALFSLLAAEKSGCVKYADFFVEVLIWVLFQYN